MTNSEEACPKCGKLEWWHKASFLSKNEKHLIHISRCDHCHTWFKVKFKLISLVGKNFRSMKIAEKTGARKPSAFNLFASPLMKQGKGLKEVAELWQKNKQKVEA